MKLSAAERWAERRLGYPPIRDARGGYIISEDELVFLSTPPKLSWAKSVLGAVVVVTLVAVLLSIGR